MWFKKTDVSVTKFVSLIGVLIRLSTQIIYQHEAGALAVCGYIIRQLSGNRTVMMETESDAEMLGLFAKFCVQQRM
jgi:hypothetical protein